MRLYFFGAVRGVRENGDPVSFQGRKAAALLAYLALTEKSHRREHLANLFWPDLREKDARNNLRVTLARVNKGLGDAAIPFLLTDRQSVQFNPEAEVWIDVKTFEDAIAKAKRASEHRDGYHEALKKAAELYEGAFLEGFYLEGCDVFEEWQLSLREQHHIKCVEALAELSSFKETEGNFSGAESYTRKQLMLEPLSETANRRLMRLLAYQAKRNAALEHYQTYHGYLQAELGIEPEAETVALYEQIQEGRLEQPVTEGTAPSKESAAHNLPTDLTPFVGRERELAELQKHLATQRLITLSGIGGIGKTRLALELARSQLGAFEDGVFLLRCAPLQDAADLPTALAQAIGFSFQQGEDVEAQVLSYLVDKTMLLVFDNLEHLFEGRSFINAILKSAPEIKLLVTSRQKLAVTGEAVYHLLGLSYATAPEADDRSHGSNQLFLETAKRTRLDAEVQEDDLPAIDQICALVEGHPLAIVLAASWLESLSCQEIAEELLKGIDLLETDTQDVPDRQRSIHAAFDHSWRRLGPEERAIYASMSVFRGGFNREAAEDVAGASLRQLSSLVNKSLVHHLPEGRFELHELMRQFAEEKLEGSGQTEVVRQKHSECYLTALVAWEKAFQAGARERALKSFEAEFENVRSAWQWVITQEKLELLALSVASLRLFCTLQSRYQTLIRLLEPVLPLLETRQSDAAFELKVRVALGMAYRSIRGYLVPEVKESFERAYALTLELDESPELFSVLYGLWSYYFVGTDFERALEVVGQWRKRLASTRPNKEAYLDDAEVVVHHIEGAIRYQRGEFRQAKEILERGISLYKPERHEAFIASYGQDPAVFCRNWLAVSYWMLGYPDKALRTANEAMELAATYQHPFTGVFALFCMVQVSLLRQTVEDSARYADDLLKQATENDFLYFVPLGKIAKGWVLTRQNQKEGLALMEKGLQTYASHVQKETFTSYFIDGLISCGHDEKALQLVDEILILTQTTNNAAFDAGLLRQKAVALSNQGLTHEAERYFKQAVETASKQEAKMLELRATFSYSRLLAEQGKPDEAKSILSKIYNWFSEGFDTADLREARLLLASLDTAKQA